MCFFDLESNFISIFMKLWIKSISEKTLWVYMNYN
jgi:hypothetical protein